MPRDYYEVLGVSRDADDAEIKKAFRRLARELHPDVNSTIPRPRRSSRRPPRPTRCCPTPTAAPPTTATATRACAAAATSPNFDGVRLGVGHLRGVLRRWRWRFGDIFGGGGGAGGAVQGGDVARLGRDRRSPQAAARRLGRGRATRRSSLCEHCRGNGAEPGTPIETCPTLPGAPASCGRSSRTPFGQVVRAAVCDRCDGDGRVAADPCNECRGRGRKVERTEAVGRRPGRDRRRAADPDLRARSRGRARRAGRRPVRARSTSARTRGSCATATTW